MRVGRESTGRGEHREGRAVRGKSIGGGRAEREGENRGRREHREEREVEGREWRGERKEG